MKYSLRSLMTFSIRDLALMTVIVALVLGWSLDRWRRSTVEEFWREQATQHLDHIINSQNALKAQRNALPNSQALAPIPPNSQAGPDNSP